MDLPEEYILGEELEAWAVYTVQGNAYQETASVRVPLQPEGLDALLAGSRGAAHPAAEDVAPAGHLALVLGTAAAGMLAMGAGGLFCGAADRYAQTGQSLWNRKHWIERKNDYGQVYFYRDRDPRGGGLPSREVFGDDRGYFMETYKKGDFAAAGI